MSKKLKVLIVSYYWPPASSVGVYRWLRFTEMLPSYEIEPIIFCPENPSYPMVDEGGSRHPEGIEIHKVPIFEWRDLYSKLMPKVKTKGLSSKNKIDGIFYEDRKQLGLRRKISLWIRANIVVPDARASWINPCSAAIIKYLANNPVDLLVTTGPPHSCHRIGLKVKRSVSTIKWMADFRDPWTGGAYFSLLPLTSWGLRRHQRMEKEVLENADKVLTVSWAWAEQLSSLGAKSVNVLTNGFDTKSFESKEDLDKNKYVMSHVGTMYGDRNSAPFWNALARYLNQNSKFRKRFEMRLIGRVGPQIQELVTSLGLQDVVHFVGVVDHLTAVREMQRSNALLLIVNNAKDFAGRIPAKVFEYLATTRPIMLIGPEKGDIHRIIEEGLYFVSTTEKDPNVFTQCLDKIFHSDFIRKQGIEQYERGRLTQDLVFILRDMVP